MRDRINSADQIETSSSMPLHSTLSPETRAEAFMAVSSLTGPGFSHGGKLNDLSITEHGESTSTFGVLSPEPSGPDSDAVWVAMQKWQNQALAHHMSGRPLFLFGTADPHRDEVEEADRKGFLELLRKSYARRADTFVWSMIVFILAAIVLIPFLGALMGPTFAVLVALCWTAVHRVRRL